MVAAADLVLAPLRLIVDRGRGGAVNMAIDDALLAGDPEHPLTVRFYAWRVPTVSLGYGQRWRDGYDPSTAARLGIDLVRRRTGGRAVLHDRELTYSISGPAESGPLGGGILATCRRVARGFVAGLAALDVEAELVRSRGRRADDTEPGACFGARALHELVAAGRKLVGSAQRRARGRVLQHGSMPLQRPDPERWEVLGPGGAEAARTTVGLYELVAEPPSWRRLTQTLAAAIAQELGVDLVAAPLTPAEIRCTRALVRGYRDPAHTLRR